MAALADVRTRADNLIREDVVFELKWDPKITFSDIAVAVKDGVVTPIRIRAELLGEGCGGESREARLWGQRGSQ